jgi:hypothetical protein
MSVARLPLISSSPGGRIEQEESDEFQLFKDRKLANNSELVYYEKQKRNKTDENLNQVGHGDNVAPDYDY